MPASIYRSVEGQAEILRLYDEALSRLGIGYESKTVSTRYGETHVLSVGPEDAPPVVFLQEPRARIQTVHPSPARPCCSFPNGHGMRFLC